VRGIGFDLGPNAVTAVVVNAGLKGVKLESIRVSSAPETGETRGRALRDLKHGALPSAIAVPVHLVSSRLVTLPFAQQAKWDAVLPAELEGQIPFELDEVIVDGTPLGRDGNRTRVLAVAAPKPTIKSRLDDAARGGIDPRVVTIEADALAVAASTWLPSFRDLALIHVDDRAVTLALVAEGRVRAMRAVLWDGVAARDEVARGCGVPLAELEEIASGARDADVDGRSVSGALLRALKPALDEIARTLQGDRLDSGRSVTFAAMSGRWSAVDQVGEAVAQALGLSPVVWPSATLAGAERPLAPAALAAGLAVIAARGGDRLNFRRGEFVYGRERAGLRRRLVAVGVLAVFALTAAGVDWGLRLALKERQWAEIDGRVHAAFHQVLPGATIVSEPEQLQTAIDALTKRREFLGSTLGVLDVLLALTDAIPPESGIAVLDLSIDRDKVRIEAETLSFDWVNKIESAVRQSSVVQTVAVSDAKTTADQSKVRFIMTITLTEGV
jgi:Tfp pilus assembly PilM family ATPase